MLNFFLIFIFAFASLQSQASNEHTEAVVPVEYSCSDSALMNKMADRLLVSYYCLTTMDKLRMEKEANYVDEDSGLPVRCVNTLANYKNDDFSERPYVIQEIQEFNDRLRNQYEERISRNNQNRIWQFFVEDILHWPSERAEQEERVISLTRKALRMSGHGIELPVSPAVKQALGVLEGVKSVGELFIALSSLDSDLRGGCDTTNVTNFEILNGHCRPIMSFTPRLVSVLSMSRRDQLLEIRAGEGCPTFWEIYGKYFGSSQ